MTKAAFKDVSAPVEEARARVAALARDEVSRNRQLPPKRRELFEAQQAQDFKKAAVIREEVEYLQDAESGRNERRKAILALHLLQAQELEDKAADLRVEIAEREIKAKSLLAQLEDHEKVEVRQKYLGDRSITRGLAADADSMTQQAIRLRLDAEHGQVERNGRILAETVDGLVEELMRIPEVIGPPIAAIYEEAATRKIGPGGRGQRLQLAFFNSRIDELGWNGIIIGDRRKSDVI